MCVPGCQEAVRNALSRRGFFNGAVAAGFAATAVAAEPAQAAPARRFKTTVDLTHTMSPDFPTFFGVPGIEMEKKFDLKKDGFNLYWWRIIEHAGTHLDAPIHFSEAGATAEKIAAETLVVPLAVVDVAAKAAQNPDYLLSREDLAGWEKKHRRLPDNCCVAMHSGWAHHVGDPGEVHRQGRIRRIPFPRRRSRGGRMADEGAQGPGSGGRHAVARQRSVEGFQGSLCMAAVRAAGGWRTSPISTRSPASGATLVVGVAKVKDATGGPARLIALV